ncbi:hypothetical protein [Bradyrhizobium sp. AUGA SZCCT0182]|uniref:hypothetical protein n=1 Tax=Bradyrhizobium sp. AUGA SZCCT0182 TaxID=2807667 RepID=UPI001BAC4F1D|nr:hypothetical protein [Bradyrhizobium sp. AUGA SZCCT0182]MBR1232046.1 hypothetical protein [Bradyrhizobium sp. AUGA SZCCT0182]
MSDELIPITKGIDDEGKVTYYFWADPSWEGFDSLVHYLQKYWKAIVCESVDSVYSRRWVVVLDSIQISIHHDSQIGNYFQRNGSLANAPLLDEIYADLLERLK